MSWLWIVIVFAVIVPAVMRGSRRGMAHGWGWGREDRDPRRPGSRERIEALEAELDDRVEEIRALESRVNELENRLDFTERLLAGGESESQRVG